MRPRLLVLGAGVDVAAATASGAGAYGGGASHQTQVAYRPAT